MAVQPCLTFLVFEHTLIMYVLTSVFRAIVAFDGLGQHTHFFKLARAVIFAQHRRWGWLTERLAKNKHAEKSLGARLFGSADKPVAC